MPYFCGKFGEMTQNMSSAAVVIGAIRVNDVLIKHNEYIPEKLKFFVTAQRILFPTDITLRYNDDHSLPL